MISFQTISSFRGRLEELVLFKRGVYAGAQEEIIELRILCKRSVS